MPDMDGFELKKRKTNATSALITGDGGLQLVERAKKAGLRYMKKPITEEKVKAVFSIG